MNYSNFIQILKNDYGVDFNEVWKKCIYCKGVEVGTNEIPNVYIATILKNIENLGFI